MVADFCDNYWQNINHKVVDIKSQMSGPKDISQKSAKCNKIGDMKKSQIASILYKSRWISQRWLKIIKWWPNNKSGNITKSVVTHHVIFNSEKQRRRICARPVWWNSTRTNVKFTVSLEKWPYTAHGPVLKHVYIYAFELVAARCLSSLRYL